MLAMQKMAGVPPVQSALLCVENTETFNTLGESQNVSKIVIASIGRFAGYVVGLAGIR